MMIKFGLLLMAFDAAIGPFAEFYGLNQFNGFDRDPSRQQKAGGAECDTGRRLCPHI